VKVKISIKKAISILLKWIAMPFGVLFMLFGFLAAMVNGKSIDDLDLKMDLLEKGLDAADNKDNSIIELVELHYGSGKAQAVSDLLNEDN